MNAAGRPLAPRTITLSRDRPVVLPPPKRVLRTSSGISRTSRTTTAMASSSPQSPQPPAAHADATATTATATAAADPAMLAPRSQRARQPALSYFAAFIKACADLWSPNDNPEGSIVVSVAENRLSKKRVADALASAPRPPDDALGYQNFRGIDPLRASLARVMQLTLLRNNSGVPLTQEELEDDRRVMQLTLLRNNSGVPLTQEELEDDRRRLAAEMFLACGAGSVVDQIFYLLASPGDGVLIPAPYYPAFDNDLAVRDGVVPIPVFLDLEDGVDRSAAKTAAGGSDGDRQKTLSEQLDEAADAWEASRRSTNNTTSPQPRVRALLLTNPSNPLGTVLKRKQLLEMARWAHEKGIHLVSDEIYGAMVWGEEDDEEDEEARFVSAWRLLGDGTFARQLEKGVGATADPQARCEALTHVVWGLSKDFCASGLRVGVLLSRNTGIAAAWGNLSYFAGVGFPLQHSLAAVLSDEAWVESFWRDNRAALRASWEALTQALDEAGIAYVRGAKGAMFCWIDLREGLIVNADDSSDADAATKAGWEAERALWRALVRDARVVVTPGEACHAPEPGFFRVCWAWMPRDALPVAVGRIRAVLDARKNGGGDGSASA